MIVNMHIAIKKGGRRFIKKKRKKASVSDAQSLHHTDCIVTIILLEPKGTVRKCRRKESESATREGLSLSTEKNTAFAIYAALLLRIRSITGGLATLVL